MQRSGNCQTLIFFHDFQINEFKYPISLNCEFLCCVWQWNLRTGFVYTIKPITLKTSVNRTMFSLFDYFLPNCLLSFYYFPQYRNLWTVVFFILKSQPQGEVFRMVFSIAKVFQQKQNRKLCFSRVVLWTPNTSHFTPIISAFTPYCAAMFKWRTFELFWMSRKGATSIHISV